MFGIQCNFEKKSQCILKKNRQIVLFLQTSIQ